MLCQNCHKNLATVRYAEVVDGKVTDRHLCPRCIAKQREGSATGFELSGPAPSLKIIPGIQFIRDRTAFQRSCSCCTTKFLDVCKTGTLGCPVCYEAFSQELESLLKGLHGTPFHRGKVPRVDDKRARIRAELQTKRALLRSSLRMENYEDAAHLRDEIKALESGLSISKSGQD